MKKIELHKLHIELLSPHVVLLTLKDNGHIEAEDIVEIKKVNGELTKGSPYGVIVDSGNYTSISNEGRNLTATSEMEGNRIAMAIIIHSLSQRMIVNFYLKINKPKVPTKSFSNLKGAQSWITSTINL